MLETPNRRLADSLTRAGQSVARIIAAIACGLPTRQDMTFFQKMSYLITDLLDTLQPRPLHPQGFFVCGVAVVQLPFVNCHIGRSDLGEQ